MFSTRSKALGLIAISSLALLAACGTTQSGNKSADTAQTEENAVVHQVSKADVDATHTTEPIQSSSAVLWVNGLGCPQCATNADLQLKRIRGVTNIRTDLGEGKIYITLTAGSKNPSAERLSEAIADAGFTLVKVETL
jgi:copper chaperone CopZ